MNSQTTTSLCRGLEHRHRASMRNSFPHYMCKMKQPCLQSCHFFFAVERCPVFFPLRNEALSAAKIRGITLRQGHDGTTVYFLVAKEPLLRCSSRDGGLVHFLNEKQRKKAFKTIEKMSPKGKSRGKRHTLHGFGCARRLAEGEMPCRALRV